MIYFLLGVYLTGLLGTFLLVGFAVGLGGDSRDLWKVIVYPLFWPIALPYVIFVGG